MRVVILIMAALTVNCGAGKKEIPQAVYLQNSDKLTQAQKDIIFNYLKPFPEKTQLSLAFFTDSSTTYIGVKREGDTLKMVKNSDKVFEIGSITKVFTATLLSAIASEGVIKPDHSIRKYLGYDLNENEQITFRQLADHSSGLPRLPSNMYLFARDPLNPYEKYDEEELKEYLTEKMKIENNPGSTYAYSNLGAGLLGHVLSKVKGVGYDTLLEEYIFEKYDMPSSGTHREPLLDRLVLGLDSEGDFVPNWDWKVLAGAGAILSTAEDLVSFGRAQFNKEDTVLSLTRQTSFPVNDNLNIGLGWHILKSRPQGTWYWHNGGTGGYRSSMVIDVENELGVIVLSNISAFHEKDQNIDDMCFDLMESLY